MPKLEGKDLFALALLAALVVFKLTGHNGTFDVPVGVIVGYYFGRRNDPTLSVPSSAVKQSHDIDLK